MRFKRLAALAVAVVVGVVAPTLAAASPAAAATGTWRPYGNTNPITSSSATWSCGTTLPVTSDVLAQVCTIRSASGTYVQAAVIVRNNRYTSYWVQASADLFSSTSLGQWQCSSSGVAHTSWSVCFGQTLAVSAWVNSEGSANGVSLGQSPPI